MKSPKVYFAISKTATNLYAAYALRHFIRDAGIELVDNELQSDYIFASICDPDDLSLLRGLRKRNPDKIIIMGGFEAYCGEPYLAWANFIVVGAEAFKQFRHRVESKGLGHLLTGQSLEPCRRIHVSYKAKYLNLANWKDVK